MFDFHMHSTVSFDGRSDGRDMALAAKAAGMREICFTDHIDYTPDERYCFDFDRYAEAYDHLEVPGLTIRRGVEYGLLRDNQERMRQNLAKRDFDFVLGSVHFVGDKDVYWPEYWAGKTVQEAIREQLEETLRMVQLHDQYDVLAHLTYIAKCGGNPTHALVRYADYRELIDEILRELVRHDKGLELNTSGIDRCGGPLPTLDYFERFKELGGKIVTVGSDAHDVSRAGQYTGEMAEKLKEIFGYVCTFAHRQPVFHR